MKSKFLLPVFCLFYFLSNAQFDPPAGQVGSFAIENDSSIILNWASGCIIERGPMDITNTGLGLASTGDSSMALGMAGSNGVVSLGDGGTAILTFSQNIMNGNGWDFTVFENGFADDFLELAFVEVSSDGINFFRFPATSNTQDTLQIGSFGALDATLLNNLAGKYRALFGTPFDLQELNGTPGLDINQISHVKIIDVVGCIQNGYYSVDKNGNKINDPWNTPFASGGFDLDAVAVIHQAPLSVSESLSSSVSISVYPNPSDQFLNIRFRLEENSDVVLSIYDLNGKIVFTSEMKNQSKGDNFFQASANSLSDGIYFLQIGNSQWKKTLKTIIQHEK